MNEGTLSDSLISVLRDFDGILLEDVIEGAQMVRIDRKYAFPISRIPEILEMMKPYYSIVVAAGKRISLYNSTYLDTPDFLFFQKHQRGYLNRDKIRYRTYPNTETTFLEIKHKSNKGLTIKKRILREDQSMKMDSESRRFLAQAVPEVDPENLIISARVDYRRIQFVSKDQKERFSIDFDIRASLEGDSVDFGPVAILEVKQDYRFTSPIVRHVRDLRYFEMSMSKYCLALTMLKPNLKSNRFKEDLRRLRKITNEQLETV